MSRRQNSPFRRVRRAFSRADLKRVCEMSELDFADQYPWLDTYIVRSRQVNNFFYYANRGSDILFVAHLDTVVPHSQRMCDFAETAAGPVVHSGCLDDRLGAYIGLELLPKLGLEFDVLLTVGEENGQSTAEFFDPAEHAGGKQYNWGIEFDRKGDDVVMYQYSDRETDALVRESGARVGSGTFSDIAELYDHNFKCFNWGCGYDGNYHSVKGYAYLEDTYRMVTHFLKFHAANGETHLPHDRKSASKRGNWNGKSYSSGYSYGGGASGGSSRGSSSSSSSRDWRSQSGSGKHWKKDEEEQPLIINGKEWDSYEQWYEATFGMESMILG